MGRLSVGRPGYAAPFSSEAHPHFAGTGRGPIGGVFNDETGGFQLRQKCLPGAAHSNRARKRL